MKLEITNDTFFEFLADFETADSAYLAAQDAMCNSIEVDDDEWNALKSACESARSNRDHYAVVLSRFLVSVKGWISFISIHAPAKGATAILYNKFHFLCIILYILSAIT